MFRKIGELIGVFIGVFIVWALFDLLLAWLALICWNYVMPVMFGLPEIGYWTMYVFLILIRILFPTSSNNSKK